ncbi:LuxR C-terminal-related transcriptional regulator [Ornithinibacillus halotolerans]|uniref:HTH luxR-type domain-containing protein n=1 Tax=Ornithinibacillus halotolerans TaxID=1274357 RepID=A0A916W4S4_9BACI|nr:LuxR C-terminal-related transcriptional regulator [Ornithinibacillus halotolerans]GGA65868.1 hypothetical protein GCM10008025_07120 [Ornithinibacillus halotolerans]
MKVLNVTSEPHWSTNDVEEVERSYFIGRTNQLNFFHEYLQSKKQQFKVIHLFGKGGVGKTYTLNEFARIANSHNIPFLHIDSQDFNHTVQDFINYLYYMLSSYLHIPLKKTNAISLADVIELVHDYNDRIIIAMDTYEQMDDLDRWFREGFVRHVHPNVSFILAGRNPLTGDWVESPAWRSTTKQIKLSNFNYEETTQLAKKNGIMNENEYETIWEFTKGLPLLISLASVTNFKSNNERFCQENIREMLCTLTKRWLSEVTDKQLTSLIEVAALLYQFNQSTLSTILGQDISTTTFTKLVSLSFVRKTHKGWSLHDLVRDAIQVNLQQRNPEQYDLIQKKIVKYYYHRLINKPTNEDIAEFFYHIGDEVIQSVFFQYTNKNSMYLEPVDIYNFHEVEQFFTHQKEHISESKTKYYNRISNETYYFDASVEHNKLELDLVGPEYVKNMGYHGATLLKNKHGEVIAISIIVPINVETLSLLTSDPISRPYFENLSKKELQYYQVPPEKTTSYFIRTQDYKDPTDNHARSFLLYNLFPLVFSGGRIITSTPLPFFQNILYKFGFQTVPGAEHNVYNQKEPTPTFLLDVSGGKLISYLNNFLKEHREPTELEEITKEYSLTNREQDIVQLILEGKPIIEIANDLYIAEITVKKALSRIYQKANVKNRIQLVKKIMELTK